MGFLDELAKITLSKLFNWSGEPKELLCDDCRKVIKHVSVSHTETLDKPRGWAAQGAMRVFGKIGGDLNPASNLFYGRPFRCTGCNAIRYD